METAIRIIQKI